MCREYPLFAQHRNVINKGFLKLDSLGLHRQSSRMKFSVRSPSDLWFQVPAAWAREFLKPLAPQAWNRAQSLCCLFSYCSKPSILRNSQDSLIRTKNSLKNVDQFKKTHMLFTEDNFIIKDVKPDRKGQHKWFYS